MKMPSFFLVAATALMLIPSCVATPASEEPTGETAQAAMNCVPECGPNGKTPSLFWLPATQMFYQTLAAAPLNQFPVNGNLPPKGRHEIIQNAIECALTRQQSVTDPYDGQVYTGWWGIEPNWTDRPLTADGRRWVTGCMVQRLNAYGITVNILPEGNTPAIYDGSSYESLLPFDESIVWGDVFAIGAGANKVYACWGTDIDLVCGEPAKYLNTRICDQAKDNCNLQIMGPCSQVCDSGTGYPICKNFDGVLDDHTVHVQTDARKYCSFGE
jgi:hypothetical protein